MASAEARIDIVIKNLGSVERLSKTLDKVNATNNKLIQSIDRATRAINQFAKVYSSQVTPAVQATTKAAQEQNNVLAKVPLLLAGQLTGIQKIQKAWSVLKSALNPVAALIGGELLRGVIDINMHFDKFKNILIGAQVPLKEINGYILEAKTTMSQFHSSTEEAANAAYDLVIALEAVNKETAEQQNLINAARGRTSRSLPGGRVYGFNNVPTVDQANVNRRDREIARRAAEQRENRLFFTDTEGTYGSPGSKQSILLKEIDNLYAKTKSYEEALFKTRLEKEELIHQKRLKNNALGNQALLDDFDRRLAERSATRLQGGDTGFAASEYGPAEPNRFQRGTNKATMFARGIAGSKRLRGAVSSGMIGGGFPLLFGQGGMSAGLGGLGGIAGGAIGGGMGFGLSIVGTAIGAALAKNEEFNKSLSRLNATLSTSQDGFKTTAKDVDTLAKRLGVTKQEAINVLNSFAQFDSAGVRKSLAGVFGSDSATFDSLAAVKTEAALAQQIFDLRGKIGNESASQLINQLKVSDAMSVELALQMAIADATERQAIATAEAVTTFDKLRGLSPGLLILRAMGNEDANPEFYGKNRGNVLREKFEENREQRLADTKKALEEVRDLVKDLGFFTGDLGVTANDTISNIEAQLVKLRDPMFQTVEAAHAIGDAFGSSFKGIIRGTTSVQEAFANMFNRIADHFADMAAQMAANQIKLGLLKMFANISLSAASKSSGFSGRGSTGTDRLGRDFDSPEASLFASGGYVTRPTVGLVGEAGENEYVIPASKMASSMQRYSAGARGNAVVAGGGSSYAGGGAGGSTTVNYSGPILNFNSEEFVPKSAIGEIIATATARGARAGETRTLTSLQNSRSRRATLGL